MKIIKSKLLKSFWKNHVAPSRYTILCPDCSEALDRGLGDYGFPCPACEAVAVAEEAARIQEKELDYIAEKVALKLSLYKK